ncbi:MAG TPA: glutamyl-tRNA reductase [Gammaproteobacteria bacterium]|nr:glutamyl-tRNA reductase [Gammaproteobacteria bacterium]
MPLITLGINHKTAPVELRERVVFAPDKLTDALKKLAALNPVNEIAILSTCNRTELYCTMEEQDAGAVIDWIGQYHKIDTRELRNYLYTYPEDETIRHMFKVATGLDSLILGEPQILGQMKDSYQQAIKAGTLGSTLGRLFQHTFNVAKQIRTNTAIGSSPVSVAYAAVSLAKQIFGELKNQTALLIGAGETIELAARHLFNNQVGRLIIANRTVERAHDLAGQFGGYGIALGEIPVHLSEADIVISSTASQQTILDKRIVTDALKRRKHKPVFMVDIAVPRDIAPDVGELEDIYLYSIDDLSDVIREGQRTRQEAAKQANEIIDVQVQHFLGWIQSLNAVETICEIRSKAEQSRDEVLVKAQRQLQQGKSAEEVLQYLANTLTNKLLHDPSTNLRDAATRGRMELLRAAQEIFNLSQKK